MRRFRRLKFLLEMSAVYSKILQQRIDKDKANQLEAQSKATVPLWRTFLKETSLRRDRLRRKEKRKRGEDGQSVRGVKHVKPQAQTHHGASLKNYQLECLQWMVSLDHIFADYYRLCKRS